MPGPPRAARRWPQARARPGLTLLLWLAAATVALPAAAADNRVAVVAGPGVAAGGLAADDLAAVYLRRRLFAGSQRLQPVNLPSAHPLRRFFSQQVLQRTPEELEGHWRDLYFNGVFPPFVLASEEAVQRFVASTPGAVGYLSMCLLERRPAGLTVLAVLDGGPPCPR